MSRTPYQTEQATDFAVYNHGSILLLTPLTPMAYEWIEEHVSAEALYWGESVVVEPRYIDFILEGILNDGLAVV